MRAKLEISLAGIVQNWQTLRDAHHQRQCGAVVKANGYGLGAFEIGAALADAGCTDFFVASLEEGIALRGILTSQRIYVFNGVQSGEESSFLSHNLLPVLNSPAQMQRWQRIAAEYPSAFSAVHIDTGMNRLGLSAPEAEVLTAEALSAVNCQLLMTHLASGSTPESKQNTQQQQRFAAITQRFPHIPASFCNSAGVFLDSACHYQLARPGCALYGINPFDNRTNPMQHCATLSAPIIQLRTIASEGETVGYSQTAPVAKGNRIATLGIGYADGWPRITSGAGLCGFIGEYKAPIIGRISMDLITLDVSHIPESLCHEGAYMQLINPQQDVNHIASAAQTIGYEIFTSLRDRIKRVYC